MMRYSVATLVALCLSIGFSSPISNTTIIHQRDDGPYTQIEAIFSEITPKPKYLDTGFEPYMIEWDKETRGFTRDRVYSRSGNTQATLGVVTGTSGSWTFAMTPSQRNAINKPKSGANAQAIRESDKFQSLFTYAILGEPSENVPEGVEMVDTPLSKFRKYLEDSEGDPVSVLFIHPIDPNASEQKMQNEALIYAMAWEISSKLGGDLSMAWMPSPLTAEDKDSRTYWYGWRRSYMDNLDIKEEDISSSPGQLVEAWYGKHKVIGAAFPASPLTADEYQFTPAADLNLVTIPPEGVEPATVNLANEFDRLWKEGSISPLINEDGTAKTDSTAQIAVTSIITPPLHHDNWKVPAVVITVVLSDFSYTLLVPISMKLVRMRISTEAAVDSIVEFQALKEKVKESIKLALLANCGGERRLLDVFVVFISKHKNPMVSQYFTRAAAKMVVASMLGMASMLDMELDTEEWSGKIRLVKSYITNRKGNHRIVVSNLREEKLSIGGPGLSSRFFYDTGFKALWEVGDSQQVAHQYTDPGNLVTEMDWP